MKRHCLWLLGLIIPALLFAGGKKEGSPQGGTEVVEIEFVNMDAGWDVVDFGKDPVTARFIEKTGVKFKCSAPQGDWMQVANVWLASGDYPEMMQMNASAVMDQYIVAGALHPINKLAQQYGHTKIVGEYIYPNTVKAWTKPDGNFYLAPNWYSEDGFGTVGQAVNVRNDIYKQYGEPQLKTMEDMYNYLVKIRDANLKSPDGAKLWPLSYSQSDSEFFCYLANIWGSKISKYNYFDEKEQKVKFMTRSPTVVSMLKWMSRALRDGLLDPDALTYNGTTQLEAYVQGKHAVIFAWIWDLWTADSALSQRNPDMYYRAIDVPQGNPGVQPYMGRTHLSGTSGTVVTKNAKNTEAAMRFINYFLSPEGQTLNFYGIEGKTMEFRNGKPYLYPEAYEAKLADWYGYAKVAGVRIFDMMNNQKYNWEREQESEARRIDRAMATRYAYDGTIQVVTIIDPLSEEGILLAEIQANIVSQLTKIIMEPDQNKIQGLVDALTTEYERKGVARLENAWTKQYLEKYATGLR
jgi:putative aldouronate transport system substrate-binding protein